jgi:Alkylmercury lyase
MDAFDLEVRRHVYTTVVEDGLPPEVAGTADALGRPEPDVAAAYRRLHDARALVLHPATTEIWMANPFSAIPTPHRVRVDSRQWFANCAWDALGIPGALRADGEIDSACACCGEPVALHVANGELEGGADLLVHILVPARRWWDDIGFT